MKYIKTVLATVAITLFALVGCASLPQGGSTTQPSTTQPTTSPIVTDLGAVQKGVEAVTPFLSFIPGWGIAATAVAGGLVIALGVAKSIASGESLPQALEDGVTGVEAVADVVVPVVAPAAAAEVKAVETTVNIVAPVVAAVASAVEGSPPSVVTAQGPVAVTPAPTNAS